jgi:hypothetical protein
MDGPDRMHSMRESRNRRFTAEVLSVGGAEAR